MKWANLSLSMKIYALAGLGILGVAFVAGVNLYVNSMKTGMFTARSIVSDISSKISNQKTLRIQFVVNPQKEMLPKMEALNKDLGELLKVLKKQNLSLSVLSSVDSLEKGYQFPADGKHFQCGNDG